MSWFEEQINKRRESDNEALSDAYESAINAIIGESFSFEAAENEFDTILRFYHLPSVKLSDKLKTEEEKLSSACRISGLMKRPVKLEKGWYKTAFGVFLCKYADRDEYIAVTPGRSGGYSFYDKKQHKTIKLNKESEKLLGSEAICFYKPLPAKKLSVIDLVKFGVSSWAASDYVMSILLLAVTTSLGLIIPKLNYFLYSSVVESGSVSLLISTMIFVLSLGLSVLFLNVVGGLFSAKSGVKMTAALQSATMMRMLSMPTEFFREYSSGEISARMEYMESICTEITDLIFNTLLSCLFSLAFITQISQYTPVLVVPSICIILIQILFSVFVTFRQMNLLRRLMDKSAKINGRTIEMISGIQKIKMSGSEKRMFARYTKEFADQMSIQYNPPFMVKYSDEIMGFIGLAGEILIFALCIGSSINVAEFYAFQSSFGVISAALMSLAGIAVELASLRPSVEMIKPILETVPENSEKTQDVVALSGAIEMNKITFRYSENTKNVLEDFSLKINAGQYIGIVGRTGCGKSTIVRLLLGFENPQKGSIYYDNNDIRFLEKRALRQKIGTVMQDDRLFAGDIYSNITICSPTLPVERAWEAAEIAGIADDIKAMPMGMHTFLSEGGGGISGGQRQRLAIARAIAPKPKILIFDEATSALDNITQKKIAEALDSLKCTRIVIAHRLSTIRHCDRILVMDQGRIVEDGSFDELIAQGGIFAELAKRQML